MQLDRMTGLIREATYIPSLNCDQRPEHADVDLIVVHGISLPEGHFGGRSIVDFFTNRLQFSKDPQLESMARMRVASHLLIRRNGQLLQFVPLHKRAWHAGESSFQGRYDCNNFSIGIELEGCDTLPYEDQQYRQLAEICGYLMHCFPNIRTDRIVGHDDVSPQRKTDPGPFFDWVFFRQLIVRDR